MTNTEMLRRYIRNSGLKHGFLAEQLGLSRAGFWLKVKGTNEFTVSEVMALTKLLKLSTRERDQIFFNQKVDLKSISGVM